MNHRCFDNDNDVAAKEVLDWVERFDKEFKHSQYVNYSKIKEFISKELAIERKRVAEEIIEFLNKIKYVEGTKELAIFTVNPIILELKQNYIKEKK